MPPKFELKLRHHKKTIGKIATTVVSDKDENLSWSGLQWHRSCQSNEMTPLPILLPTVFLGTGNCSYKIVHESFFLQYGRLDVLEVKAESVRTLSRYFGMKYGKTGRSWWLTVICSKRSAFDHAISPHSGLKTCVKDRGDSSGRLLERRICRISMYRDALVSGFLNSRSSLTNKRIIFKPLDRFFFLKKKKKIFLVI